MNSHSATPLALKYLQAKYQKEAGGFFLEVDPIYDNLRKIQGIADQLRGYFELVEDLMEAGEKRRLGRVQDISVGPVDFDGQRVQAKVAGKTGTYDTRITVLPKRGHRCTCQDWLQNGPRIGPCKHVLALGLAWKNERLLPAVQGITDGLEALVGRQV